MVRFVAGKGESSSSDEAESEEELDEEESEEEGELLSEREEDVCCCAKRFARFFARFLSFFDKPRLFRSFPFAWSV